jgi:hypothetical protein
MTLFTIQNFVNSQIDFYIDFFLDYFYISGMNARFKKIYSFLIYFTKYALLAFPAFWMFALSLRPVVSIDALKLHMALPAAWKNEGFFFFRQYNAKIELGMMNIDYLYTLLLKFLDWEPLPKIVHASFLVATGILTYRFVSKRYGRIYGILSYWMILTLPINQRLASEVYVDLGLLFFSSLSVIYFLKAFEKDFSMKFFIISSIACGLAAGSKFNGLVFAFIMGMIIIHETSKHFDVKKMLTLTLIFSGIVLLSISPWLIRNYSGSGGNPFYPLFGSVFSSSAIQNPVTYTSSQISQGYMAWRYYNGESFLDVILIPLRFFFTGKDYDHFQFDGVLNPLMLLLMILAFVKSQYLTKRQRFQLFLIVIFMLIFASYYSSAAVRYALPFTLPLTILNIEGLKNSFTWGKSRKFQYFLPCIIVTFLIFFNLNYSYKFAKSTDILNYLKGNIAKEEYLKRYVISYDIYEFINSNLPEDAVIYDVLCGNKMYYVKRKYVCSESSVNWWFNGVVYRNEGVNAFYELLQDLPNTNNLKADYLLIKPYQFYKSFSEIYFNHDDPESIINKRKLDVFTDFLKQQTPLIVSGETVLYKINYEFFSDTGK